MTENRQGAEQTVPAAWENALAQMSEEWAAKESAAQVREMQQMSAFVEARAADCYRLKIDHARSRIAEKSAKRAKKLRWWGEFDPADCVLEATQVYLKMLAILDRPDVQDDLSQEGFIRLVDQLTEECLFVIDNPDVWPVE